MANPDPGFGIRNKHPDSYFQELNINIIWVKNALLMIRIRDLVPFCPWIREGKIRIRDKHPLIRKH
jgi:hypothetical protein